MLAEEVQSQIVRELALQELNDQLEQSLRLIISTSELDTFPIDYYCECSLEECQRRITLSITERRSHRAHPACFIIIPDHANAGIESVSAEKGAYSIVQKDPAAVASLM